MNGDYRLALNLIGELASTISTAQERGQKVRISVVRNSIKCGDHFKWDGGLNISVNVTLNGTYPQMHNDWIDFDSNIAPAHNALVP